MAPDVPFEKRACAIHVPAGSFWMGAQSDAPGAPGYDPDASPDEAPVRRVEVAAFWIQHHEVTVGEFRECVQSGGCSRSEVAGRRPCLPADRCEAPHRTARTFNFDVDDRISNPVVGVTWRGAADYCHWLGGRLPTEAEWEYAARGPSSWRYPWGRSAPSCRFAIMREAGKGGCGAEGPREAFEAQRRNYSWLGLVSISGGVWEWTADWYADAYAADASRPQGPAQGTHRVIRGGGWTTEDPTELRSAFRAAQPPDEVTDDVGFRCAADEADVAPRPENTWRPSMPPVPPEELASGRETLPATPP